MKKPILKSSYEYKNSAKKVLSIGFSACLITAILTSATTLIKLNNDKNEKLERLRQETGYTAMIDEDITEVQEKLSQGSITNEEYNTSLDKILVSDFEGYLKNSSNKEALTEFNEIQNNNSAATMYFLGSSTAIITTMATIGYAYSKLMKKADERKIEEQKFIYECEGQNCLEYYM